MGCKGSSQEAQRAALEARAEEGADSQLAEPADRAGYFLEGVIQTTLKHCDLATSRRAKLDPN